MQKFSMKRAALLLCGAAVIAVPAGAWAQAATPTVASTNDGPPTISEIVVTATRIQSRQQDVAMSLNVETGDKLEKLNVFDIKDISQLAPGLDLTNTDGRSNSTTLRGVTFNPDSGTAPAVQVYLNEIPTDAQVIYAPIYDIQDIEVLRGPQGLLRGLSAPAGSITIATRRPNFDHVEGYAETTATNREGYNVQAGVSLPFSDTLAIRVAGLVDGNRINDVVDVNRNNQRSYGWTESARITIGWKPLPGLTTFLTYQHLDVDTRQFQQVVGSGNTPAYQLLPFLGGYLLPDTSARSGPPLTVSDYGAVSEGLDEVNNRTDIVNLAADYDLGPATLSFVGAHQSSLIVVERDLDNGNAVPGYISNGPQHTTFNYNTGELRLTSNNTEGLGWGVGAFYTKQSGLTILDGGNSNTFFFPTSVAGTKAAFGAPPYLPINTNITVPTNASTASFNANLRYKSGPFKAEAGVRYSIEKNDQTTQVGVSSPGNTFAGVPAFALPTSEIIPPNLQKSTYRPLTGGADISYDFARTLTGYVAYGHSARQGSTGVGVPSGISPDLIRTKNETTDSIEAGLKGSFANRRLSFTVDGFYQKLENYLSRFQNIFYDVPANQSGTGQQELGSFDFNYNGNATIKGVEGSLDGHVTRDWDISVQASYTHGRYNNATLPCNDFAGTGIPNANGAQKVTGPGNVSYCVINSRLADVPDFSLTANTEIRFPMATVTPFVRALLSYRPGFYSQLVNFNYEDRENVNLYLGLRTNDGKWEINAFAKNLLNQQRITNISLGNAQQPTSAGVSYDSGYRTINATNRRSFGITAHVKW
ncbi:TonB-dependent receptor [Novosphingobium sp.]|uniref:TonB-dependent receptor n=1 Tax=Novosphingobium sp. TaxID=1874826 RepID=UPI003B5197B7